MQKVGAIAYKLQLPPKSRIHPDFHVSQLKKKLEETVQVQHQAPSELVEQILEPELILERRMVNMKGKATIEVLVKWKQLPLELAIWKKYWALAKRFPGFDLGARSNLRGET